MTKAQRRPTAPTPIAAVLRDVHSEEDEAFYVHSGILTGDWDAQYDGASRHTDFYLHTLREYLTHFAPRPVAFATFDGRGVAVRDFADGSVIWRAPGPRSPRRASSGSPSATARTRSHRFGNVSTGASFAAIRSIKSCAGSGS